MEMVDADESTKWIPEMLVRDGIKQLIEEVRAINKIPTKEELTSELPITMKLKTLQADAKDLFLCKNGEILFRVEE